MKWKTKSPSLYGWHTWFAWFPVRLSRVRITKGGRSEHTWVWLTKIERKYTDCYGDEGYIYREINDNKCNL